RKGSTGIMASFAVGRKGGPGLSASSAPPMAAAVRDARGKTEKPYNSLFALQPRHIDVEVHPVDPFDRKLHMTVDNIGHALCYHCLGSGRAVLPLAGV